MRGGKENHNQTSRLKRSSEDLKLAECPRFVEPKQLKQIWVLVKSRVPEFVEPKQLEQTRVLVKHARLIAKRAQLGLTRESKATSESTQKDRQVSNTRRSQAFETRLPGKEDGGGAGPIS